MPMKRKFYLVSIAGMSEKIRVQFLCHGNIYINYILDFVQLGVAYFHIRTHNIERILETVPSFCIQPYLYSHKQKPRDIESGSISQGRNVKI